MAYGWFKVDVSQIPLASLSGGALKCFLALASVIQEDQSAVCSYGSLCASLRISKRTAYRAIAELVSLDLIVQTNAPNACLSVVFKNGVSVGRGKSPADLPTGYRKMYTSPGDDNFVSK